MQQGMPLSVSGAQHVFLPPGCDSVESLTKYRQPAGDTVIFVTEEGPVSHEAEPWQTRQSFPLPLEMDLPSGRFLSSMAFAKGSRSFPPFLESFILGLSQNTEPT